MQDDNTEPFVIASYSRAEAIADGTLADVTSRAKEAGIKWPTAVTEAVWGDCILWSNDDPLCKAKAGQDQEGRLWDVVWMARCAMAGNLPIEKISDSCLIFEMLRVPRDGIAINARSVKLKIIVGPGDDPKPVVTIMMPTED